MSQSVAGGWHTTMLPPAPDFIPTIDDIRIRPSPFLRNLLSLYLYDDTIKQRCGPWRIR